MALNLFRRHRRNCQGGHQEDSCSSEFEERRPRWKRCDCPIHASGTLVGQYRRRCTDRVTWEEALKWASAVEAMGRWDPEERPASLQAQMPTPPGAPDAPTTSVSARATIMEVKQVYLAHREAMVAPSTFRKDRTFMKQLAAFGASRGYLFLDQFRAVDLDLFFVNSRLGPRSKVKRLEALRRFFRFAANRELIPKSPVSPDLKPPAGASRPVNKMPFTDEQLEDIIKACDQLEDKRWGNRFGTGVWTGEDVKEFIWVMVFTGLRISDVVLFDMTRVYGNAVYLRAKKNGGDVFTWIPDWLRDRLNARAKRCGRKIFLTGQSPRIDTHRQRAPTSGGLRCGRSLQATDSTASRSRRSTRCAGVRGSILPPSASQQCRRAQAGIRQRFANASDGSSRGASYTPPERGRIQPRRGRRERL